jgi:hypothetical protein
LPSSDPVNKVFAMNLNSPLFDRIRMKPAPQLEAAPEQPHCDHPGCRALGEHRAPMGRLREGQYFCFCLEHVREYNQSYNYFNGMSDADVAKYQRDAVVGHRPTWAMGVNRAGTGHREEGADPAGLRDPLGMFRARPRGTPSQAPKKSRHGVAGLKALATLGLDETANAETVKARYKELVKRLHPDANGGDRSLEDKLREIIHAYNYLKTAKPA